jgi:pseudaminic acid cytidylyltransferase
MRNLCIIPARGGSKRIPKKNIKTFMGKPILAYPIEAALRSGLFREVMVSTDDDEICSTAIQYGARVPFIRSAENSDDYTPLSLVINEVIESYCKIEMSFDNVCCILPTAVLLNVGLLKKGYDMLCSGCYDSVRTIQKFSYPIQRAYKMDGNNLKYFYPEYEKVRSQDLEPAYHDAGVYYWIRTNAIKHNLIWGGVIISELEAQDIDNLDDWVVAEFKYKILNPEN